MAAACKTLDYRVPSRLPDWKLQQMPLQVDLAGNIHPTVWNRSRRCKIQSQAEMIDRRAGHIQNIDGWIRRWNGSQLGKLHICKLRNGFSIAITKSSRILTAGRGTAEIIECTAGDLSILPQ